MHIIKELVENSLDAKASKISVTVKSAPQSKAITEIIVSDDGDGIAKEHFEFLCQTRYTTKDRDLLSFGYRGEALSYISRNCVLHVQSC